MAECSAQSISISEEELQRGHYDTETLAKALNAMHQDGFVVLKDVIPVALVDHLNNKMCHDAEEKISNPSQGYNHGIKSNILQRPPIFDSRYLSEEIYFNTFLLQVATAYLGHKPIWNWLTSNVALAKTGGIRQPVHKDTRYEHPQFPYYFIANIPLCDFNVENGATEFWLGSHAHTTWHDQAMPSSLEDTEPYAEGSMDDPLPAISEEAKEIRIKTRPPVQTNVSQGRHHDSRLENLARWHAKLEPRTSSHVGLGIPEPIPWQ